MPSRWQWVQAAVLIATASVSFGQIANEFYSARSPDSGFALELLGNAWASTNAPITFSAQEGFTIQLYVRPMATADFVDTHVVQLVSSPIELERSAQALADTSTFGNILPQTPQVIEMDLYMAASRLFLDVGNLTIPLPAVADTIFSTMGWQLLTVSIDMVASRAFVYVDKTLVSSGALAHDGVAQMQAILGKGLTGHAMLGRTRWGAQFVGQIDDFRLLSRPISEEQVRFVFEQRNLPVALAGHCLLEWRFDEILLSNVTDSSVAGHGDGTVFVRKVFTNADGSQYASLLRAPAVRFDGVSAAKVPSAAGVDAAANSSGSGAISPALTRRTAGINGQALEQNTSTAVRIIDGRDGRAERFELRIVPTRHNVTLAVLPSCGSLRYIAKDGLPPAPVQPGDVLTSDEDGTVRLEYTASAALQTSLARADEIGFSSFAFQGQEAAAVGQAGFLLKWVEVLRLLVIVNEVPTAPSFVAPVVEDTPAIVSLGAYGDVAVQGMHFQADTEGQRLHANITLVPQQGRLFHGIVQTGSSVSLGAPILQKDVPVTLAGSNNQLVYVPPADVSGKAVDTITYSLSDEVGARSLPASITFQVVPVHDAPLPGTCKASDGSNWTLGTNGQGAVQVSRITQGEQNDEAAWLARSCSGLCQPEIVRVDEDGTIDFKLSIRSVENALIMVDMVSAPFHGQLFQLMTSSRNQNPAVAPARKVELNTARSARLTLWADSVVAVSSERSAGTASWASAAILGPPDVYPNAGDNSKAWSPGGKLAQEWIELEFGERLYVSDIRIYETWFPGHIVQVSFRHPDGTWVPAWTGDITFRDFVVSDTTRVFAPPMCEVPFPTSQVRIDLALSSFSVTMGGVFPQIDAVLISGSWTPPPRRLLFTPGPSEHVADIGHANDGSSSWGSSGGTGSGGTGSRRGQGQAGDYASSGGSGRSLLELLRAPKPVYWLRYVPNKDFAGSDRLVFATNDCDWDRTFRGVSLPCQEVAFKVQPANDQPELLNPWGLKPEAAAQALVGKANVINASLVVIENTRIVEQTSTSDVATGETPLATGVVTATPASASSTTAEPWAISTVVQAVECTGTSAAQTRQAVAQARTGSIAEATLQQAIADCGVAWMLRSRDPDEEDQTTRFAALSQPTSGEHVVSEPLRRNITLNLRVNSSDLVLSGQDSLASACSILNTDATAADETANIWLEMEGGEDAARRFLLSATQDGQRFRFQGGRVLQDDVSAAFSTGLGASGNREVQTAITLEEKMMTASVVLFIPKPGLCGSAVDSLLYQAEDDGVSDLYGNGGTSGSKDSLASSVVRVVINVRCTPGSRRLTPEGSVTVLTLAVVAGLVNLVGLASFGVCWCRQVSLIKRSQPLITMLAGVGGLTLVGVVLIELAPPQPVLCDIKRAAQTLAFVLAFGAPAAKVFRVFRLLIKIHLSASLPRVTFPESALVLLLAAWIAVEGLFLATWSVLSPSRLTPLVDPNEPMLTHLRCNGQAHALFFPIWILVHLALVAFTLYLAAITRNVHYQRGESRWIGYTVYALSLLIVAGVVSYTGLEGQPQLQTLVACVIALIASCMASIFMLMRRVALVTGTCTFIRTFDMAAKRQESGRTSSNNQSQSQSRAGGRPSSDPRGPQTTMTRATEQSIGPSASQHQLGDRRASSSKRAGAREGQSLPFQLDQGSLLSFGSSKDFLRAYTPSSQSAATSQGGELAGNSSVTASRGSDRKQAAAAAPRQLRSSRIPQGRQSLSKPPHQSSSRVSAALAPIVDADRKTAITGTTRTVQGAETG